MLTPEWALQPGGYCSEPPPEVSGSAHGPMRVKPRSPPSGAGRGPEGHWSCPSLTFTVSLGIFLLEASLRGQSSSEERAGGAIHLTGTSDPHRAHFTPRHSTQAPGSISVPTWRCEFFYLGLCALKGRQQEGHETSYPAARLEKGLRGGTRDHPGPCMGPVCCFFFF